MVESQPNRPSAIEVLTETLKIYDFPDHKISLITIISNEIKPETLSDLNRQALDLLDTKGERIIVAMTEHRSPKVSVPFTYAFRESIKDIQYLNHPKLLKLVFIDINNPTIELLMQTVNRATFMNFVYCQPAIEGDVGLRAGLRKAYISNGIETGKLEAPSVDSLIDIVKPYLPDYMTEVS